MSVKHLAVVAEITGLSPTRKLLLYGLATQSNGLGYAQATTSELCRLTGLSERAIRANLRALERAGVIRRVHDVNAPCWELPR